MKFTNSPLISYKRISPNKTVGRNHKIDTITIHCMAGNCTIETCGEIFAPRSRQASSNYGVGTDGRIGMYVEEKDRSWCTSSAANDHRAVTIEVANNGRGPSWPVSANALSALIDLCTDICRRNGIKQLMWKGDKTLKGQVDKQNMTVHRWFANTDCPGDYLYNKMGYIADQVNKKLNAGGNTVGAIVNNNLTTTSNEDIIWNFFKDKGLNDYAIAGIMGNLYAEASFQPRNLQNTYEKVLGYTDDTYTKAVDSGKYTNFAGDHAGYGIAQWTYHTRKRDLLTYTKNKRKSIGDLQSQLEFLWNELNSSTYKDLLATLKSANNVKTASDAFLLDFERPAAKDNDSVKNLRNNYSQRFYDKHASTTSKPASSSKSSFPYRVRVTANALNVRAKPSTSSRITGCIRDKGIYTITAESTGSGARKWGKLKSGLGWISLDYCEKC